MKYSIFFLIFLYLLKLGVSEFEVLQSELPLVKINSFDYEYQLKERSNLSIEIRPSPTLNLNGPSHTNKFDNEDGRALETPSPLVAALFQYDKEVVQLFRHFLAENPVSSNVSLQHRRLIERYVEEWDGVITDSKEEWDREINKTLLPKELEVIYKLIRMSHRVSRELPPILEFSNQDSWTKVVQRVQEAEADNGQFFSDTFPEDLAYEIMKLSGLYSVHPQELYPKDIIARIPLKDLVAICLSGYGENLIKEPLKWLSYIGMIQSKQPTATFELERRSHPQEGGGASPEASSSKRNSSKAFSGKYLELITDILSFKHDSSRKYTPFDSHDDNIYPELLSQAAPLEQLEKTPRKKNAPLSYENLCNGLYQRNATETRALRCRMDHLNAPWLYLMPAKVEVLLEEPPVLLFHQVLTDEKIKILQRMSILNQENASTVGKANITKADHRIRDSFVTFLPSSVDPRIMEINKFAAYLTGLEAEKRSDGEDLQVNVYRPGGHYMVHHDGFGEKLQETKYIGRKKTMENGDRLATLMFYLNAVQKGGNTIFSKLGLAITPEKGAAVLWFSLLNDGKLDDRLLHAGCPVVSGYKWVANKWIHYDAQLFKRPCLAKMSNSSNEL